MTHFAGQAGKPTKSDVLTFKEKAPARIACNSANPKVNENLILENAAPGREDAQGGEKKRNLVSIGPLRLLSINGEGLFLPPQKDVKYSLIVGLQLMLEWNSQHITLSFALELT